MHAYESPERTRKDLHKMRDQRSVQDEHLLSLHSGRGGASNVPLRHQRSMPASDDHHDLQKISNNAHQPQVQHGGPPGNYPLYSIRPGSGGIPPQQQFPPHHDDWHQENKPIFEQFNERDNMHVAYKKAGLHIGTQTLALVEGSRVQIPCNSPGEPFKYGVIRWIGDMPAVQGFVAGIELVR